MATTDLRPLSLGELLDRTFSLYRGHFWLFVGIMAVPQLIILAVGLGTAALTTSAGGAAKPAAALGGLLVVFPLLMIAYFAAYGAAQAATTFAVSDLYLGRPTSVGQAYGRVRGKVGRTVLTIVLLYLLIAVGLVLLLIPGIWVALRTAVTIPVAMLENLGASAAIGRSMRLSAGSAGRTFLIFLLMFFIAVVAGVVFTGPGTLLAVFYAKQPGALAWVQGLNQIGSFFSGVLVGPMASIAFVLLYYDLRVRKEAFDLQLMMSDLDRDPSAAGPAPA